VHESGISVELCLDVEAAEADVRFYAISEAELADPSRDLDGICLRRIDSA
jgi:hypothetical protein